MKHDEMNRRTFLSNTLSVTAAVPFLALVGAAACKEPAVEAPVKTTGAAPAATGPICDLAKVPEAEMAKRNALGYVDTSTMPDKNCLNCNLYKADNGAGCPGCTLFAGPITGEGYCNSWIAKPA